MNVCLYVRLCFLTINKQKKRGKLRSTAKETTILTQKRI